jgi:hypothetical protein
MAVGLGTEGVEQRTLDLRGRDQGLDAWVVTARREAAAAAP